jgi:hypothetical protein
MFLAKKIKVINVFPLLILMVTSPILLSAQHKTSADLAVRNAKDFEKMPRVPVPERPFLFLNKKEIEAARTLTEKKEWAKKIKENYIKIAEAWVSRDYNFIKKIIPAKGSIYIYGLGMDLDPVQQKKLKWQGWKDPLHVIADDGIVYPNATHPDDGSGWTDPDTKRKFYFMAVANGRIIKQLETIELPALVNAYLLTGNETYAERALWMLDAIATVYPRANEGPIDYPGLTPGKADGGRLDRPYYQASRALMNYAYFAEMLFTSDHALQSSPSNKSFTMLKNIELNLLMNGADYCLRMAKSGHGASYELNNGNIDYNRSPLVVGAMLGITDWVDWALNGPLGFRYAISNTIDINGRYFETGSLYAQHTRELLLGTAYFLKRMKLPAYPDGYNAYDDTKFSKFALSFFTGIQVNGRLPLFGDSGPDNVISNDKNIFDKGTLMAAQEFYNYSKKKEIRESALETASQMLENRPVDYTHDEADLFHIQHWEEFVRQARLVKSVSAADRSTLFFDYGTLILRSGKREKERAALMRFGPTLNHGQADELGLNFYARGREFSFDPGYYNTHLRFGFTTTTIAHNVLVVNRTNQLRQPSPGGDLQTWTDGEVLRSAAVNDPKAYSSQGLSEYKRRVALIDLSPDDSYIIDNFWALGGHEYDYSLHGISKGKLQILSASKTVLKEKRNGSVLSPQVDYSAELDPNGRVASLPKAPFYFAPPGGGYGFLSSPAFYSLNGAAHLQWSATDTTNHEMYVWHFAPPSSELIIAQSPKPRAPMDLTYVLSHVKMPASKPVRFTSVILQTGGENKLAEVQQLLPKDGSQSAFALHLIPASTVNSTIREHYYMASDKVTGNVNFEDGLSFSGEEGFLGLDASGKIIFVSLTGAGHINKGDFKFTVTPLFTRPLRVLQIENQPLRLLVNASYEETKNLEGSMIRLNKHGLIRPFVLLVNKSEAAGKNSWLTIDASGNAQATGTVQSYDPKTNSIATEAPFPHTRPYTYTYSEKTGFPGQTEKIIDYAYNGGYNGFWLVGNQKSPQRAVIKNMIKKRTQIVLEDNIKGVFKPGDKFEIQLLAPGDQLEVPVWSQVKRDANGNWQVKGTGIATVSE